jgi:hypothetical protein
MGNSQGRMLSNLPTHLEHQDLQLAALLQLGQHVLIQRLQLVVPGSQQTHAHRPAGVQELERQVAMV